MSKKPGYVDALASLKAQPHHKAKEIGDQWRTPDWLFWGIAGMLDGPIVLDLFTDGQNAKVENYFTAETNALKQSWAATLFDLAPEDGKRPWAYANPPYSIAQDDAGDPITGMRRTMAKAIEERDRGASQVWLVKAATSETWWPVRAFCEDMDPERQEEQMLCDHIIHIKGRIAFEPPAWYRPAPGQKPPSGAGFGASLLFFCKDLPENLKQITHIHRDYLKLVGEDVARQHAQRREEWISRFDDGETKGPFYWVHDESCSCGVESTFEGMMAMQESDPCVMFVPKEMYEQRRREYDAEGDEL